MRCDENVLIPHDGPRTCQASAAVVEGGRLPTPLNLFEAVVLLVVDIVGEIWYWGHFVCTRCKGGDDGVKVREPHGLGVKRPKADAAGFGGAAGGAAGAAGGAAGSPGIDPAAPCCELPETGVANHGGRGGGDDGGDSGGGVRSAGSNIHTCTIITGNTTGNTAGDSSHGDFTPVTELPSIKRLRAGVERLLFACTMGLLALALSALLWVVSLPSITGRIVRWMMVSLTDGLNVHMYSTTCFQANLVCYVDVCIMLHTTCQIHACNL